MSACAFLIGCTLHVCDSVCVYVFVCVSRSVCSVLPGVKWGACVCVFVCVYVFVCVSMCE